MEKLIFAALLLLLPLGTHAASNAPWGGAQNADTVYAEQKVVYDVAVNSVAALTGVLDRVSYLSNLNGGNPLTSSIVLVLHGAEIPYFAIKNFGKYKALMQRAQSLSVGEVIQFKMCAIAAQAHGLKPKDIHGFVEMVPMGDAEIVRLQQAEGHAYMR